MYPEQQYSHSERIIHLEIGASSLQGRAFSELSSLRLERADSIDPQEFLREADAALITSSNAEDTERLLADIRQADDLWMMPVFLSSASSHKANELSDGIVESITQLYQLVSHINHKLSELPPQEMQTPTAEFKLCAYLYSRPDKTVLPVRAINQSELWRYPLVDAFGTSEERSQTCLSELELRGLIHPKRLIDRVRDCASCDSAQLSFIDVCPDCQNIDIENSQFFHCFTCGHVAPEANFIRRDSLRCPQCEAKFKHIGVDYDRPLEEYRCRNCNAAFIEGSVIARCLACNSSNHPEWLRSRRVNEFELTGRALHAVRHGEMQTPSDLVDDSQFASPAYFTQMVDWLLSLSKRYPDECFSLLSITVETPPDQQSMAQAQNNDVFFRRIAELTRETDLIHRLSAQTIWVLLPKNDSKGRADFERQTRQLATKLRPDNSDKDLNFVGLSVPEDLPANYTTTSILRALQVA
ncbi:MAG: hypothetical protein AB8B48_19570 [Pseudomonadales bacterium]